MWGVAPALQIQGLILLAADGAPKGTILELFSAILWQLRHNGSLPCLNPLAVQGRRPFKAGSQFPESRAGSQSLPHLAPAAILCREVHSTRMPQNKIPAKGVANISDAIEDHAH
jgi:hypothetical protein